MDSSSVSLNQLAIDAALECQWKEALKLNRQIIKQDPENVDALNRLARVFFELDNLNLAKKYYNLALKFDPYNPIAIKNLKIIHAFKNGNKYSRAHHNGRISPSLFLQEPGKTKVVSLLKVAEPQKLSLLFCGMPVQLTAKNRGVTVADYSGGYLGVLPDDTAHNILRLIKGGNKYNAIVKSIKVNGISILIKETFRSSKFKNQPSFLEYSDTVLPELIPVVVKNQVEEDEMLAQEEE